MSKPKFSKGDIVRKCTGAGTPIGPWLMITLASNTKVHTKCLESNENDIILTKKFAWKPKMAYLAVSENTIKRVKAGRTVISHPASARWKDLLHNFPDVVVLYTMLGERIYCIPSNVYYVNARIKTIRLIIDRVICC